MRRHLLMLACTVPTLLSAAPIKSGFLTTSDGVRLHYLESGTGPAILFVPGWTMPAEIWEAQIRHFSQRYRVVALDPRSQGESAQAAEGHYPERRAQDIKEVVDQLRLSPVALVGWSMGVQEALTYVDEFGTFTLHAVVLVDGNIGEDPKPLSAVGDWTWVRAMQFNRREFTENFVRSMYKKPQPETYYQRITAAALKTPTTAAVTLLANEFARADWRPVLSKLNRPVLYAITPGLKAQAETLKARIPSARVEIFGDCGHALFVDDAARFNAVLEDFLRAVSIGK